eukprot:6177731-Pleurochrysis_carterae.AAC.4
MRCRKEEQARQAEAARHLKQEERRRVLPLLRFALAQPLLSDAVAAMLEPALEVARGAGVDGDEVTDATQALEARRVLDPAVLALVDRLELGLEQRADLLSVLLEKALHTLEKIENANLVALGLGGVAQLVAAQRELKLKIKLLCVPSEDITKDESIGNGAFGCVCKARLNGRELALKQLRLTGLTEAEEQQVLKSARREAHALQQLKHPNVVEFVGMVVDDASAIGLLMELSVDGNLRNRLSEMPPLDHATKMHIATGVAAGMAYLHSCKVLHHDLKSANLLLFEGEKCTPKLADFGLAKHLGGASMSTNHAGAGTFAYQAPEQFLGEVSEKSEVYSFGIILWELLHGQQRPWGKMTGGAIMQHVLNEQRRPPVSDSLENSVLKQCMKQSWAQEPAARPDFASLLQRLRVASRTFATSNFKRRYDAFKQQSSSLLSADVTVGTRLLIQEYAQRHRISSTRAHDYFLRLHRSAVEASAHGYSGAAAVEEVLTGYHLLAVRMYASALELPLNTGRELCFILNEAIREDCVDSAMPLVLALNKRVVTRGSAPVRWPADNTLWRGGSLPDEHHHFFVPGKRYRVPMFLSTSASRETATKFTQSRGAPHFVLWKIKLDPHRRCVHVNYIDRHDASLGPNPNIGAEDEFLFAPYSVFTVERVKWRAQPSSSKPHRVVLIAAADNSTEPEDLPSAPWA